MADRSEERVPSVLDELRGLTAHSPAALRLTAHQKSVLVRAAAEIERLRDALTGIYRGAPRMSHAHLTAAAALGKIREDGRVEGGGVDNG